MPPLLASLAGGVLVGLAALLMLVTNGRIAGNSGIIAQCLGGGWRLAYVLGLLAGAAAWRLLAPHDPPPSYNPSTPLLILAGLLVGFGTRMGGGCTSGHGVCGLARLSVRSLVATLVFMAVSMVTVLVVRWTGGAWW